MNIHFSYFPAYQIKLGELAMRVMSREIRKIQLKEMHCKQCSLMAKSSNFCVEICEIGKKLTELNNKIGKRRARKNPTKEQKWDAKCKQAMMLFQQGHSYLEIAKKLRCHVSSLYRELKKRELLLVVGSFEKRPR